MTPDRRNQTVLAALVLALGGLIYWLWPATAVVVPSASTVTARSRPAAASGQSEAPGVHLDELKMERPKPSETDRNLFRFKPKPAPPAPAARPSAPAPIVAAVPAGPPPPPPLPPIALKFIGIVSAPDRGLKVAVLSDQYGVYYGREGETVLGQYRILRVGAESLEISYLDGRGRQTIRLNGS